MGLILHHSLPPSRILVFNLNTRRVYPILKARRRPFYSFKMYVYLFLMSMDLSLLTSKKTSATTWEKLMLVKTLLALVAIRAPALAVKTLFRDRKATRSFMPALRNAMLRSFLSHVNGRQLQAAFPSTSTILHHNCKKSQLAIAKAETGVPLHWMGDPSAKKVIIYSHGGGYALPALDGHVKFLQQCVKKLKSKGDDVVVAWVDYDLTPTAKYPEINKQAVECVRHVLGKGYSPSDIIIGGDSAGAAITLSILLHITHPHPKIEPLALPEGTRFAGALLLCPWINLAPGAECESFKRNAKWDYIHDGIVEEWAGAFATPEEYDEYSNAIQANTAWLQGLPVQKTLVLAGGSEVLVDDVVQLGERMKNAAKGTESDVDVVIVNKEIHIECIMDAGLGLKHGEMAKAAWDWLERVW